MASTKNSNGAPGRRGLWLVLAVVILLLLYSYTRTAPLRVHVTAVERGPIRSLVSTNGKIEPIQNSSFEAHAPIATTVKRLLVNEGDHVRKGELLLQLDDADIRSQAARAEEQIKAAQAEQIALRNSGTQEEVLTLNSQISKAQSARDAAQRNLDSAQRLQKIGAASEGDVHQAEDTLQRAQADFTLLEEKKKNRYAPPEVEKVQAQALEAQAAYDAAEDALKKSSIHAPFDGTVYSLPVKQGAFVQTGDLLLQEANLQTVLVRAFVDEPDIGRLQEGQKVEVTSDAIPGRVWNGTVSTVPSTVKPRLNRNIGEATCTIDNHDLRLLPNGNVGVSIVVAQADDVLTLQRDAVHVDDRQAYVYRIDDGHLKQQPVTISLQNLTRVEITSGLDQGAKVALSADEAKPLFDGAAVKVIP